jgi:23S rRNA (uridine2552-2'-O)-methyltransferase
MRSKVFNPQDRFFRQAKKDGFLARSAYKLDEVQKKYKLIRSGDFVVDLGASPGAWSQIAEKVVADKGRVVALDIKPVSYSSPRVKFYQMDVFQIDPEIFEGRQVDVMLSDMAANTTGIRSVDQARSEALCMEVIMLSGKYLRVGGNIMMKLFEGGDAESVHRELRLHFETVKRLKPEAVRKGSFETYLLGFGRK